MGRLKISVLPIITLVLSLPLAAATAQDAAAPEKMAPTPIEAVPEAPMKKEADPAPPPVPMVREAPPPMLAPAPPASSDVLLSPDGKSLQLVGEISQGTTSRVKAQLEKHKSVRTLILTSEGGLLVEGAGLAHLVRSYALDTHVEFLCGSACTFPLLAGKQRTMAPDALIGFHQASVAYSPLLPLDRDPSDLAGNHLIRSVYASANVGPAFIDRALQTPPTELWFPDIATLQSNNVITRIAKSGEFSIAASTLKSSNDFTKLLTDPIWAATRTSKPDYYRQAVAKGWTIAAQRGTSENAVQTARDTLVRLILSDAIAYPDALIGEFIAVERKVWEDSKITFNRNCEYGPYVRFPVARPKAEPLRGEQLAILRKMLAIPSPAVRFDAEQRPAAQAKLMNFWGRMIAEKSFNSFNVSGNFCREPLNYYTEMAKLPTNERAELIRSLVLVENIGSR
jgi:hypothetical protein